MASLDDAFRNVRRENFLPAYVIDRAHSDIPLPIGYGQTNSQPTTVYLMLMWLEPESGDRILDVGSGSGWTTALLAYLVGTRGRVYGVERIEELVDFGRQNCKRQGITNAAFYLAGKELGLTGHAPYDRILVGASSNEMPMPLLRQLKTGGKIVVPVGGDVLEVTKLPGDKTDVNVHPGFTFVPLISETGGG